MGPRQMGPAHWILVSFLETRHAALLTGNNQRCSFKRRSFVLESGHSHPMGIPCQNAMISKVDLQTRSFITALF